MGVAVFIYRPIGSSHHFFVNNELNTIGHRPKTLTLFSEADTPFFQIIVFPSIPGLDLSDILDDTTAAPVTKVVEETTDMREATEKTGEAATTDDNQETQAPQQILISQSSDMVLIPEVILECSDNTIQIGPPEWRSGLRHCSAVSLQSRVQSWAISLLDATGRPMMRHTIGPVLSGLGEGLAGRDVLVPLRSSDSLWRARHMHVDFSHQLLRCFL